MLGHLKNFLRSIISLSLGLIGLLFFVFASSSVFVGLAYASGISVNWFKVGQVQIVLEISSDFIIDDSWEVWSQGEKIETGAVKFNGESIHLPFLAHPYLKYTLRRKLINCEKEDFELNIFKEDTLQIKPKKYIQKEELTRDKLSQLLENNSFSIAIATSDYWSLDPYNSEDFDCPATDFVLNKSGEYGFKNTPTKESSIAPIKLISDLERLFELDSINREEEIKRYQNNLEIRLSIQCFSQPEPKLILLVNDRVYISKGLKLDSNKEYQAIFKKYFGHGSNTTQSLSNTSSEDTIQYSFEEIIAERP